MSRPYVLPNRKTFADSITRILLKYRGKPMDDEDKDVDLCAGRGSNAREMLPHQKVVRDYLLQETPYRGLLFYHGLGSGKSCSSIAVAESLLSERHVYVMLPASLEANYRGELRKCGDPIYMYEQHWRQQTVSDDTRAAARKLGISDGFIEKERMFFTTVADQPPNYMNLPKTAQDVIGRQVEDIINQRFTFIRYNGLMTSNIEKYAPSEGPNPYDNSVVIIDEVHNLISRITSKSEIARKLYDKIYTAKNCKVVALSGTPVINRAYEVAFLMNLLRGPIERVVIPVKATTAWDEEKMMSVLRGIPDVDTVEFNATKKYILVTRNPPNFRSVYNEKGDRTAVQYVKDMRFMDNITEWVASIKNKFETEMGGTELAMDRVSVEMLECLPTDYDEFANLFLDGLNIKNVFLFQRRIQGLVSYYKGADERMLPRRVEDEKTLEKIPMSNLQFNYYLQVRWDEIKRDARKKFTPVKEDDSSMKSFRVVSRLACNYAIPPELRTGDASDETATEDTVNEKENILNRIRQNPAKYLTEQALQEYSPKLLRLLQNIKETMGDMSALNNQFVYSQYRKLEGLNILSAILDTNGWQEYKIVKEANQWVEDPSMDPEKPAYAFYSGEENPEEREYMRQIYNGKFADNFPQSLKASIDTRGKKILCLLMVSSSGAEGITLVNVRRVHIMEPHWNPARHDQVIGRAIRICSHAGLPVEERTVRVSFYVSVFTEQQSKSTEGSNNVVPVRRNDTALKRYEGDPVETFMTTDEYLYETSYEKDVTNKRIATLLKQAAVDCEIHRKLHSRETPVVTCMRFDTTATGEDLAFKPSVKSEDVDSSYIRNMIRKRRRLQKVQIKQMVFYLDPDTKEVFDGSAFEDNERLLRIGEMTSPTQIRWITL